MKGLSEVSGHDFLVCPYCEGHELELCGQGSALCSYCGARLGGAMLRTLEQVTVLTDASGAHPCECGHPEMRRLPDRIFHCPACGSEVLPIDAHPAGRGSEDRSVAYRCGWFDGRYGERGNFASNPSLARWEDPSCRLAYYEGHRHGGAARLTAEQASRPRVRGFSNP